MKTEKKVTAPKSGMDSSASCGEVRTPSSVEGDSGVLNTDTTGANAPAVAKEGALNADSVLGIVSSAARMQQVAVNNAATVMAMSKMTNPPSINGKIVDIAGNLKSLALQTNEIVNNGMAIIGDIANHEAAKEDAQELLSFLEVDSEPTEVAVAKQQLEQTGTVEDIPELNLKHEVVDVGSGATYVTDDQVEVVVDDEPVGVAAEDKPEAVAEEIDWDEPIKFKEGFTLKTTAVRQGQRVGVFRSRGTVKDGDHVLTIPTSKTDAEIRKMAIDIPNAKNVHGIRGTTVTGSDTGGVYWGAKSLSPRLRYHLYLVDGETAEVSRISSEEVRQASLHSLKALAKKTGFQPSTLDKHIKAGTIKAENVVPRSKHCNKRRLYDLAVDDLIVGGVQPHIANRKKLRKFLEHRGA